MNTRPVGDLEEGQPVELEAEENTEDDSEVESNEDNPPPFVEEGRYFSFESITEISQVGQVAGHENPEWDHD